MCVVCVEWLHVCSVCRVVAVCVECVECAEWLHVCSVCRVVACV